MLMMIEIVKFLQFVLQNLEDKYRNLELKKKIAGKFLSNLKGIDLIVSAYKNNVDS